MVFMFRALGAGRILGVPAPGYSGKAVLPGVTSQMALRADLAILGPSGGCISEEKGVIPQSHQQGSCLEHFSFFRGKSEPPLFQSRNSLSSRGWPASAWTGPWTGSFSFARQVPRSLGSKGLPSFRMRVCCSANPSLCTDGKASESVPTGTSTKRSHQRVTPHPPTHRDTGQCPPTFLAVLGWHLG